MLICGIILWCVILVSRSRDPTNDRVFFRIYLLSTIIELIVLILKFGHSFRWKNTDDVIHIGIASIRTVLFLILLIISHVSKTRRILVSGLEAQDQASGIADRSFNYGTFDSTSACLPSAISSTPDIQSESPCSLQYIKVDLKVPT